MNPIDPKDELEVRIIGIDLAEERDQAAVAEIARISGQSRVTVLEASKALRAGLAALTATAALSLSGDELANLDARRGRDRHRESRRRSESIDDVLARARAKRPPSGWRWDEDPNPNEGNIR